MEQEVVAAVTKAAQYIDMSSKHCGSRKVAASVAQLLENCHYDFEWNSQRLRQQWHQHRLHDFQWNISRQQQHEWHDKGEIVAAIVTTIFKGTVSGREITGISKGLSLL